MFLCRTELYSKRKETHFSSKYISALTDYLFSLNLYFSRNKYLDNDVFTNKRFLSFDKRTGARIAHREKFILMRRIFFATSLSSFHSLSCCRIRLFINGIIDCKLCLCAGSFPDNVRNLTSLGESYQTQARSCHSLWERRAVLVTVIQRKANVVYTLGIDACDDGTHGSNTVAQISRSKPRRRSRRRSAAQSALLSALKQSERENERERGKRVL